MEGEKDGGERIGFFFAYNWLSFGNWILREKGLIILDKAFES